MENVYIYARVLHVTAENMLSVIVTSSQSWNDQRKGGTVLYMSRMAKSSRKTAAGLCSAMSIQSFVEHRPLVSLRELGNRES